MLHNLMERVCAFDNLLEAYRAAAKGKRYREEVLRFTQNLEKNLFAIREELLSGTYQVGPYREFYVRYPKPRLVMALEFRDRVVQHAIYRQLNPYLDKRFIADSYACRAGKGTLKAVNRIYEWEKQIIRKPNGKEWYYLKIDIAKFFYRVDHRIALDLIRQITDDEKFLQLMDVIINNPEVPFGLPEGASADECPKDKRLYEVGMPIGNLSSQMMANMYLDVIDQFCKHVLHIHYYARYMDDIVILHDDLETLHRWRDAIEEMAWNRLRLRLNRKTAIRKMTSGMEFIGRRITPSGVRIRKSSRNRVKRVFTHIERKYARGSASLDKVKTTYASYIGLIQHCNSHNLRCWLDRNITFCKNPNQPPIEHELYDVEMEQGWEYHLIPPPDGRDGNEAQEAFVFLDHS